MTSWRVGDVEIHVVTETELRIPAAQLIPSAVKGEPAVEAVRDWALAGDDLRIAIQAFVIHSRGRTILVDACLGNERRFPWPELPTLHTDFVDRLAAAGASPDEVDTVICTHLHVDHVGWLTHLVDGRWEPTFPNAEHLLVRAEWEHWEQNVGEAILLQDTVAPVVAAGLHRFVTSDEQVTEEVQLESTAGHTPGHVSVRIASRGERCFITGDAIHHPVQVAEPDWVDLQDTDAALATATRRRILTSLAASRELVLGTHFPAPTAGVVRAEGHGWSFEPRS